MKKGVLPETSIILHKYLNEHKIVSDIAKEFGVSPARIADVLKQENVRLRQNGRWFKNDLTGKVFGRLTAIERIRKGKRPTKYKSKNSLWRCICVCGKERAVFEAALIKGATTSCGCLRIPSGYTDYMDIGATYWKQVNHGAAVRKLDFAITQPYIWHLFQEQNQKCIYTGLNICFSPRHGDTQTASIDRIDSGKGYIVGNVQIVHKVINVMKFYLADMEFVSFCNLVAEMRPTDKELAVLNCNRILNRKHDAYIYFGSGVKPLLTHYTRKPGPKNCKFDTQLQSIVYNAITADTLLSLRAICANVSEYLHDNIDECKIFNTSPRQEDLHKIVNNAIADLVVKGMVKEIHGARIERMISQS